jgi:hypothetical protein
VFKKSGFYFIRNDTTRLLIFTSDLLLSKEQRFLGEIIDLVIAEKTDGIP